jgi:hypothetical protein
MRAYLTSIGEKTTWITYDLLEEYGFEVVLLDKKESWEDKYKSFLRMADEDCLRIDADVIPNEKIKEITENYGNEHYMVQFKGYDFYRNGIGVIGVTFYSKEALEIIRNNLDKIDWRRPEATAWRLKDINNETLTEDKIVGTHGYLANKEEIKRHLQHKIERKQILDYNFDLVFKLYDIYEKD